MRERTVSFNYGAFGVWAVASIADKAGGGGGYTIYARISRSGDVWLCLSDS